jgi:hypothetical protein
MSPQAAADAWKQYMQPFAGKAKLVSPAITNGGAPAGEAWLDAFFAACHGCTVDAVAIHIYDSATNEAYFKSYIPAGERCRAVLAWTATLNPFIAGKKYKKPVWVTEFAGKGSQGDEVRIRTIWFVP